MKSLYSVLLVLSLCLAAQPQEVGEASVSKPSKSPPPLRTVRLDTGGPPGQLLKNLVRPAGLNSHNLTGYGLVVGLPNTGDSSQSLISPMMTHLLTKLGLEPMLANVRKMKSKNVAVVAVTAKLPPIARSGDPINVEVASLGDAKNLSRGVLLRSILRGPDNKIYASAQGRITALPVDRENRVVGIVSEGGTVSRSIESKALTRDSLILKLLRPNITTASRIADKIGLRLSVGCRVVSADAVEINLSGSDYTPVSAMAIIEGLSVKVDQRSTIIVNRETKSVVVGGNVPLKPALISHKGMTVEIGRNGSDLKTVLESLSRMGADSDDIVAIIESLRHAGALSGQIEYR